MSLLFILIVFCSAAWTQAQRPRCPPSYFECPSTGDYSQCIPYQYVCDGIDHCGNNTDESDEACAQCPVGWFKCPSGRPRCIPPYRVCNGHNNCEDNSDESFELCGNRSCPVNRYPYRPLVKCEGLSPTTWCVNLSQLCDGVDNCGNNWDEDPANCARHRCPGGRQRHRCLNSGVCIDMSYTCNGYDDCGDLSDENAEHCRVPRCSAGFVPCPSGRRRCISEEWLCDGYDDCGDGSDEDQDNCLENGAYAARHFINTLRTQCIEPVVMQYSEMTENDIWIKLASTNFAQTCRPVLTAQECATRLMTSAEYHRLLQQPNPKVTEIQKMMVMVNDSVNFVCRDNVKLFDDHKGCLLVSGEGFDLPFRNIVEHIYKIWIFKPLAYRRQM